MHEIVFAGRVALAFEGLSRRPQLRHVFTTRGRAGGPAAADPSAGNVSLSRGDAPAVLAERRFWSAALGVQAEDWVVGGQCHGARVVQVGERERGRGATDCRRVVPGADGLSTVTPGLPLYVSVADCAAVLLFAPGRQPAIAVAHAGWRGLRDGILLRAVESVCAAAGLSPAGVEAGVSPCIGLNHFQVGDEVAAHAPGRRRVRLGGRWHVDLAGWASDQLLDAGLAQGRIEVSGLDTYERADLFFSHRRDGEKTGRMGLVAALASPAPLARGPRA